jgi:hypothetical protein
MGIQKAIRTKEPLLQMGCAMLGKEDKNVYVRVKDKAGNDFLCPIDALRNPNDITDDEMAECVDDATVQRYAGDIKIKDE